MKTRCKFVCSSVTLRAGHGDDKFLYDVVLDAVTNGSEENESFWKWTPSGKLEFSTIKTGEFVPGAEYYIDISAAIEAAAAIEA